jgi:hypothetical protein
MYINCGGKPTRKLFWYNQRKSDAKISMKGMKITI